MANRTLKHKPLVEAVFELRWKLQELQPGVAVDPHYKLLVGRVYDRVSNQYPFHEPLPSATFPDEVASYLVQHRFRKGQNEWPLLQLGPGIATVNDTAAYTWRDFQARVMRLLDVLFETYPDADTNLRFSGLLLRYINTLDLDYLKSNVLDFLRDNMGTTLEIREKLFEDTEVGRVPSGLDLRLSFPCTVPKGTMDLRFVRDSVRGVEVLRWETGVRPPAGEVPSTKQGIAQWVGHAHDTTEKWFFGMIHGELLRRFE